jgi:subtilisin family serine protease
MKSLILLLTAVTTMLSLTLATPCLSENNAQALSSFNENDAYFKQASEKAKAIDYGKGRVIAVLDTGINDDNIELHGQVIAEYDTTTGSNVAVDKNGHGTRIASVIAAKKDDRGITGIAYEAKLIDVKVVDDSGNIETKNIISGIKFAVEHGADVINMSFSSKKYFQEFEQVIEKFSEQGVLFVASAGNDGSDAVTYPAGYKHVTAVSSLERGTGKRAVYANYGEFVDEYVEDDIWTYDGAKYSRKKGTSEATGVISSTITITYKNQKEAPVNKTKYNLTQEEEAGGTISFFSEDNVNDYLNDLAAYNLIQPRLIGSFQTTDDLKLLHSYNKCITSSGI